MVIKLKYYNVIEKIDDDISFIGEYLEDEIL